EDVVEVTTDLVASARRPIRGGDVKFGNLRWSRRNQRLLQSARQISRMRFGLLCPALGSQQLALVRAPLCCVEDGGAHDRRSAVGKPVEHGIDQHWKAAAVDAHDVE